MSVFVPEYGLLAVVLLVFAHHVAKKLSFGKADWRIGNNHRRSDPRNIPADNETVA